MILSTELIIFCLRTVVGYAFHTHLLRRPELQHADTHTQYLPFNGGPRVCIGQQFALTEIGYTVIRMLQKYDRIDRYGSDGEMKLRSNIIMSPADDVRVGFWKVGQAAQEKA